MNGTLIILKENWIFIADLAAKSDQFFSTGPHYKTQFGRNDMDYRPSKASGHLNVENKSDSGEIYVSRSVPQSQN